MPLFDFKCNNENCELLFEVFIKTGGEVITCPACGTDDCVKQMNTYGGYHIKGNNSASQRPKQAGSFKK